MGRGRAEPAEPCAAGALLAARLRELRERTGLSLKELQGVVHASDSSLSRYLSGRIVPPWQVVRRLAEEAGADPAGLRPLWDHVQREDHRSGRCVPFQEHPSPPTGAAPEAVPAWYRRRPVAAVGALVLTTSLVSCGLGVWIGRELPSGSRARADQTASQDAVCDNWAWPPTGTPAQVAVAPATVHGADHTPTVRLEYGTVDGRRMAWAAIGGAHYGDRVWMDWSDDDGETWTQCGPFTATTAARTTPAHPLHPGWHFRACGDTPRPAARYARDQCTTYG
ncbi:helix-turn-helix domain-containing protein [Streptomyces sp. cg40]|uniref:helix-turn-helix domain-containing protein n=1 Tax=Streptomyces sp. cg40 TaxID=3419764 RepID=UPI003D014962